MAEQVLENPDDRNRLVNLLASLDAFTGDARSRRDFVRAAGLGKFIGGIDWAGPANTVAGNLVDVLNSSDFLVDSPNYHALGKLLVYCLDYPQIGVHDVKYLATLIVRKGLVRDPAYLENVRRMYSIADEPPPEIKAPVPAVSTLSHVAPPPFKPILKNRQRLERVLSEQDNFLDIYLLVGALYCAQAVGRVEAPEGQARGTGWLIAPNMILTNCHVLPKQEYAAEGIVRFGYVQDVAGVKVT